MRNAVLCFASLLLVACGGSEPHASTPPAASAEPAPTHAGTPDAMRPLGKSECEALAQKLVDACNNVSGVHSARVDGWCSNLQHAVAEGSWVTEDCMQHMKRIDLACFEGTTGAGNYMACDESVDRSH